MLRALSFSFAAALSLSLAGCGGSTDGVVSGRTPPPSSLPQAICPGGAASAPLAKVDSAVTDVATGPCGRVAYTRSDASLWLVEPGAAPVKIADGVDGQPIFDETGAFLLYASGIYDLAQHRAAPIAPPGATTASGAGATTGDLLGFAFVYDRRDGAAPVPIPFFVTTDGVYRVSPDGTAKRVSDPAIGRLGWRGTAARFGSIVIVQRDADAVMVAVDAATGRTTLLGIDWESSMERQDKVFLSRDGRVLVRQLVNGVPSGDTYESKYASTDVVDTTTGKLLSSLVGGVAGGVDVASATEHTLALRTSGDGFTLLDDTLALHTIGADMQLVGLLDDGTVVASRSGYPNKDYRLLAPTGGADAPLVTAEDAPVASRTGAVFGASRLTTRCVKNAGASTCQDQIWELVRTARAGGGETVLASATQPIQVHRVGDDGSMLVGGRIFTSPPPAEAPSGFDVDGGFFAIDAGGALHPIATPTASPIQPSFDGGVTETGGLPIVLSRDGSDVRAWAIDPARGAAVELARSTYDLEVDGRVDTKVVALRTGDRNAADLYVGEPAAP